MSPAGSGGSTAKKITSAYAPSPATYDPTVFVIIIIIILFLFSKAQNNEN
jgi:hypothetical protein